MQKGQTLIFLLLAVVVTGFVGVVFYIGQQIPKPPAEVVTTTPQPISIPIPTMVDETANWKTYTSLQGDYSFKYPLYSDWVMSNALPDQPFRVYVSCGTCSSGDNIIGFEVNRVNLKTINEYLKKTANIKDSKRLRLQGKDAVEVWIPPFMGAGYVQYFVINNSQGYTLSFFEAGGPYQKLIDIPKFVPDILSTFKFLDQEQDSIDLPPLYPGIKWSKTEIEKYPFSTGLDNPTSIEKDAIVAKSIEIFETFPPADLVEEFKKYYTDWFKSRNWEVSLLAGGLSGQGGTGSYGYSKDGHYFEFGLPMALSKNKNGKSGFQFYVIQDKF